MVELALDLDDEWQVVVQEVHPRTPAATGSDVDLSPRRYGGVPEDLEHP